MNSRDDSGSEQEREKTEPIVELPTMYRTFKSKEEEDKCEPELLTKEVSYQYSRFLQSGRHYFYFIKDGRYFCLSDKYPIKRFKQTNLFMNEILI